MKIADKILNTINDRLDGRLTNRQKEVVSEAMKEIAWEAWKECNKEICEINGLTWDDTDERMYFETWYNNQEITETK